MTTTMVMMMMLMMMMVMMLMLKMVIRGLQFIGFVVSIIPWTDFRQAMAPSPWQC